MIERIYVHNYRCFENFTLDLSGLKSALIIGKNGAGKSTLRAALGVFRKICRGPNVTKEWINPSDFWQNRTELPMRFEITVSLAGKKFDYGIAFEFPPRFHQVRILDEKLSVDGNMIFSRQRNQVTLGNGANFLLDWHVGALPIINEKPEESSVQQVKSFLSTMILLSPMPREMSGFAEEESFELREDVGNFAEWLNAVLIRQPARYNDILKYLQFMFPDLVSFEFVPRGERGKQLYVVFESEDKSRVLPIDFRMLSDGEKCFFLSALVVAVNRPESPLFCFWDEPDNHLSLPEVGHFVTQLKKMTNRSGQFIAASHNPEVIRRFSSESTLIFHRKSYLEPTLVRVLARFKYDGDLIEALIRDDVVRDEVVG